jgi:hypothetical protein
MSRKLIPMAIAWDFDGTLAPGNIQENSFIPEIGMKKATFWQQNKARAEKHEADEVLSYMTLMLERASAEDVPVRRQDFARHGKTVPLFRGAADWFDRVNARSRERHVKLQHYIISSGIKEMIEATKIGKKFAKVFARPSLTMQTAQRNGQRLRLITRRRRNIFSVNKGSLSVHDHGLINTSSRTKTARCRLVTSSLWVTVIQTSPACGWSEINASRQCPLSGATRKNICSH